MSFAAASLGMARGVEGTRGCDVRRWDETTALRADAMRLHWSCMALGLADVAPSSGELFQAPAPPEVAIGAPSALVFALLLLSAWVAFRVHRHARRHGTPAGLRSIAMGAALGNALLDFGAMFMPNRAPAEVLRDLEEHTEVDAAGDGVSGRAAARRAVRPRSLPYR